MEQNGRFRFVRAVNWDVKHFTVDLRQKNCRATGGATLSPKNHLRLVAEDTAVGLLALTMVVLDRALTSSTHIVSSISLSIYQHLVLFSASISNSRVIAVADASMVMDLHKSSTGEEQGSAEMPCKA